MADHLLLGMDRKWQRHYRETTQLLALGTVLLGASIFVPMVFIWPQILAPMVFNARLDYKLMCK